MMSTPLLSNHLPDHPGNVCRCLPLSLSFLLLSLLPLDIRCLLFLLCVPRSYIVSSLFASLIVVQSGLFILHLHSLPSLSKRSSSFSVKSAFLPPRAAFSFLRLLSMFHIVQHSTPYITFDKPYIIGHL